MDSTSNSYSSGHVVNSDHLRSIFDDFKPNSLESKEIAMNLFKEETEKQAHQDPIFNPKIRINLSFGGLKNNENSDSRLNCITFCK